MYKKLVFFVVGLALCSSSLWHGLGAMEKKSPDAGGINSDVVVPVNKSDTVVINVVNDASVQCPICHDDLKFSDPEALKDILNLACEHGLYSFHKKCITEWPAISLTCPSCRQVVDVKAEAFVKQLSPDEYKALKIKADSDSISASDLGSASTSDSDSSSTFDRADYNNSEIHALVQYAQCCETVEKCIVLSPVLLVLMGGIAGMIYLSVRLGHVPN